VPAFCREHDAERRLILSDLQNLASQLTRRYQDFSP
jgi:hypothetical protein